MHLGRYVFLGTLIGLVGCVYLTVVQPRMLADLGDKVTPPTPILTPAPKPASPSPSGTVAVDLPSIKILFFNVKLTVVDPVTDLVYGEVHDGDNNVLAGFTTKSLLAKYPRCTAGALGTLNRVKATPTPTPSPTPKAASSASPTPFPSKSPTNQPFKKTVAGYTYSYRPSYSTCADDAAGRNTVAAAKAALINGVLPTIVSN